MLVTSIYMFNWLLTLSKSKPGVTFLCFNPLQKNKFLEFTAWKVSKYGVFSGPYFPIFGLNTEIHTMVVSENSAKAYSKSAANHRQKWCRHKYLCLHYFPWWFCCRLWLCCCPFICSGLTHFYVKYRVFLWNQKDKFVASWHCEYLLYLQLEKYKVGTPQGEFTVEGFSRKIENWLAGSFTNKNSPEAWIHLLSCVQFQWDNSLLMKSFLQKNVLQLSCPSTVFKKLKKL